MTKLPPCNSGLVCKPHASKDYRDIPVLVPVLDDAGVQVAPVVQETVLIVKIIQVDAVYAPPVVLLLNLSGQPRGKPVRFGVHPLSRRAPQRGDNEDNFDIIDCDNEDNICIDLLNLNIFCSQRFMRDIKSTYSITLIAEVPAACVLLDLL